MKNKEGTGPIPDVLFLRINGRAKERIRDVAQESGQSLTTFVKDALDKAVKHAEKKKVGRKKRPATFGALPGFFKATVHEARRGGEGGYYHAGRILMLHVTSLAPYDVEDDEWAACLDVLERHIGANDDDAVLAWFEKELPRCMDLVPKRRREQFLRGVYECYEEENPLS
jgi:hypothetical protein